MYEDTHLRHRYETLLHDIRLLLDLTDKEVHNLFVSIEDAGRIARMFEGLFADPALNSAFREIARVSDEYNGSRPQSAGDTTNLLDVREYPKNDSPRHLWRAE